MDWMELHVLTSTQGAELVSQALIDAGSTGTLIEDKNDYTPEMRPKGQWDFLDESVYENMSEDVLVTGYYPEDEKLPDALLMAKERIRALRKIPDIDFGRLEISEKALGGEDWAESWKKAFKPIRLAKNIVISPRWCGRDPSSEDKYIFIDPGMAFGTGNHETTALCAELLADYLQKGDSVIDIGTGTGILAMTAALLGAKDVLATDIDPVAVRVAEENIADNGLDDIIRCAEGDLLEAVDERADIAVANIITDVIVSLVSPVRAHINEGGILICSGIAAERKEEVLSAVREAGCYTLLEVREKGAWCAVAARRNA